MENELIFIKSADKIFVKRKTECNDFETLGIMRWSKISGWRFRGSQFMYYSTADELDQISAKIRELNSKDNG